MPNRFWERGSLTKWEWFWSRLGFVIGCLWLAGILPGLGLVIYVWLKCTGDTPPVATALYLVWYIGGFLACWTCLVLGGFTTMGSKDPWE